MTLRLSVATKPRFFAGASLRSQLLGFTVRRTVRPLIGLWTHLPFMYWPPNMIDLAASVLPVPSGTRWESVQLADCRAEWIRAKGVQGKRVVLYMHGGAFMSCGMNTHRRMAARISAAADAAVFSIDYRMMPRDPIASSVIDGVHGYQWLLDNGYKGDQVTIAGDSAGGYLAFAVARAAIDEGLEGPAGVVALSPLLDFDSRGKLSHPNANRCQTFPSHAFTRLHSVADEIDGRHMVDGIPIPRVAPVDMELSDLPPTLIQVGSREILLADAELMAHRLVAAGVPCDLQIWDRQVHVFQAAAAWIPEGRRAIAEIADFIRANAGEAAHGIEVDDTGHVIPLHVGTDLRSSDSVAG